MSGVKTFIVTAIHDGYLGSYRTRGDTFEVTEAQFADRWMVKGDQKSNRPVVDLAKQAKQEALAAGGPSAALTQALADLKDAGEREAAALARVAELEEAIAARDAEIAERRGDRPEDTPVEPDAQAAPEQPSAPVQRVRRTPVSA